MILRQWRHYEGVDAAETISVEHCCKNQYVTLCKDIKYMSEIPPQFFDRLSGNSVRNSSPSASPSHKLQCALRSKARYYRSSEVSTDLTVAHLRSHVLKMASLILSLTRRWYIYSDMKKCKYDKSYIN